MLVCCVGLVPTAGITTLLTPQVFDTIASHLERVTGIDETLIKYVVPTTLALGTIVSLKVSSVIVVMSQISYLGFQCHHA